jgi:undecaprenyl-diphosphatase
VQSIINAIHSFDVQATRWVQLSPAWTGKIYAYGTRLGSDKLLPVLTIAGAVFFLQQHNLVYALAFGLAGGAMLIISGLKEVFRRARPANEYAALQKGFSFPSGHAGHSIIFYGLVAYILYTTVGGTWATTGVAACIAVIILVGSSRVYLGAHFPSDVLAAWLLGSIFVSLIINYVGI